MVSYENVLTLGNIWMYIYLGLTDIALTHSQITQKKIVCRERIINKHGNVNNWGIWVKGKWEAFVLFLQLSLFQIIKN